MDTGAMDLEDLVRNGTAPPARVGLYSALSAASGGSDGWRVLAHAGGDAVLGKVVKVEKGFLVGARPRSGKAKLISGLEVPAALVAVLKQRARPALEGPSLLAKLTELHGAEAAEDAIQAAVRRLDEEGGTSCVALREILGRDAKVRYRRLEDGTMVFAAIDLAQAVKGCIYKAAQKTVWRIAQEYYNVDLDDSPKVETNCLHFRRIIFGGQGSRPTLCVTIAKAVELVALIPGSEVAAALRQQCAEAFVRVAGGDLTLVDDIFTNRELQDYLAAKDPDNPFRALGEFAERGKKRSFDEMRGDVQDLSKQVGEQQLALQKLAEAQQLALQKLAEAQQLAMQKLAETQQLALQKLAETQRLALERHAKDSQTAFAALLTAVSGAVLSAVEAAVLSPTSALVAALRAATRPPSRKHRHPSELFPPAQQATSEECAVLSTTLVAVAKNVSPALSFGAWRALRSAFGRACKAERLRRLAGAT
jgi:hypothetical protein